MARKDNKGRNLKTGEYQRPDGRYEYRYDPRLRQPSGHSKTQTEYLWYRRCNAAESRSGCFLIGDNKNTAGDRPEWSVSGNRTVRSYS